MTNVSILVSNPITMTADNGSTLEPIILFNSDVMYITTQSYFHISSIERS